MNVEKDLRSILGKWKKDASPLESTTRLEELEIDSLDLVEVIFEIEEKFDIQLAQSNEQAKSASFADLCSWIEQQLAAKRQAGNERPLPGAA